MLKRLHHHRPKSCQSTASDILAKAVSTRFKPRKYQYSQKAPSGIRIDKLSLTAN